MPLKVAIQQNNNLKTASFWTFYIIFAYWKCSFLEL